MPLRREQKKPNPNKTFFQNYGDHLKYEFFSARDRVIHQAPEKQNEIFSELAWEQFKAFVPLYDMHEYTDDIFGFTVVPFALASLSLAAGCSAIALAVQTLFMDKNAHAKKSENMAMATFCLGVAIAALSVAFISFAKSGVSLITRPLCTLAQGWNTQNRNRFMDDTSREAQMVGTFVSDVKAAFRFT